MLNKTRFLILLFVFIPTFLFSQNDGENLFNDLVLREIRLTNVDTNLYITTKDYQMVNMEIDGNIVSDIGFKRKGNISGYPATNKFPIKIKTNKYVRGQKYDGIKEFMLHMNHEDPSMLREKLTYEICAEMGLYSLRTSFAKVYLNDIYWGLYTIVEGKDEMYKHVFDNRDADAMESSDFGNMCYEGPNISDYEHEDFGFSFYENDNGDDNTAWSRFIKMLDKINNTPNEQYVDTASTYLNIKDFFRYQAINVYLLNMDSYISFIGNQRYVYDTTQNIWQVTPWDFNSSFGLWNTNNHTVTDYAMFPGFRCFGNKVNDIPELRKYYMDAMCELTNIVCDTSKMFDRIDALKLQIEDAVYTDNRKVVSNQDFDDGLEFGYHQLFFEDQPALKTVIRERYKLITNSLNDEPYECSKALSNDDQNKITPNVIIYPNPAMDILHFESEWLEKENISIKIVDYLGREVVSQDLHVNSIGISHLENGLYFCIFQLNRQQIVQSFVKQ